MIYQVNQIFIHLKSNKGEIDYISKVAKTPGEICALIEAGFEYVAEFEGLKFFRKRKS
jgi:hypothetical protein